MKIMSSHQILAVVSCHAEKVGGQAPVFYVDNEEELNKTALYLSRVLMAAVHDLDNGVYILVKH